MIVISRTGFILFPLVIWHGGRPCGCRKPMPPG